MKKLFFVPILFVAAFLRAEGQPHPRGTPFIDSYVSGAFIATNTYSLTQTTFTMTVGSYSIVLSSFPLIVHAVVVNKLGDASTFEFFNTNRSTTEVSRRVASIDTSSVTGRAQTYVYDAYLASGCVFTNFGSVAADVTLLYRIK